MQNYRYSLFSRNKTWGERKIEGEMKTFCYLCCHTRTRSIMTRMRVSRRA